MDVIELNNLEEHPFKVINSLSAFRLSSVNSLEEVISFSEKQQKTFSSFFLTTFDDVNQATYTSMHASTDESIYLDQDIDWDDERQVGQYDSNQQLHICDVLAKQAIDWQDIAEGLPLSDDDLQALRQANENPDKLIDDVVYLQKALSEQESLKIAALPNGYFSGDLNIFQNHCIVKRMIENYQYRFLGLGASWLVFYRQDFLSELMLNQLVDDLKHIYGQGSKSEQLWQALALTLKDKKTLLIGYGENILESLE